MRIIRLLIAFDGTGYCGWQRQKNGPSIQETIERALSIICNEAVILHGAGRTDAGVHAEGMSAHFQTNSTIDSTALKKGLNALLPGAIRIISLADAAADFHARFSAQAKTYRSGEHDFSSFETTGSRDKDRRNGRGAVRTIFNARLSGPEDDYLQFFLTGDGFLRHMVRNLIGTILEVGKGKRTVQEFVDILGYRDRNRAAATAPSRGLCLIKVHYERDWNSG
ncbi:MAG: tRNA pseudouridine synthase A [Desulfofustis sp.]